MPGETVEGAVTLGNETLPFACRWEGDQAETVPPRKQLAPGKYRRTFEIPWHQGALYQAGNARIGTLETEPVEFERVNQAAASPAG